MVNSVRNRAVVLVVPATHQAEKEMTSTRQSVAPDDDSYYHDPHKKLFDITCVIGTVYADMEGELTARQVAYMMICDHNAEGTFSFPMEDGGIEHVTVERENPS